MGVDQSMSCTGVAITFHYETGEVKILHADGIRSSKLHDDYIIDALLRAHEIYAKLHYLILEHKPTHLIFEGLSLGSTGQSTRSLAIFLGALLSNLCNNPAGINDIHNVSPSTLKKFATGKGNATKEAMLEAIKIKDSEFFEYLISIPQSHGRFDIADAYWLAQYANQNFIQGDTH